MCLYTLEVTFINADLIFKFAIQFLRSCYSLGCQSQNYCQIPQYTPGFARSTLFGIALVNSLFYHGDHGAVSIWENVKYICKIGI